MSRLSENLSASDQEDRSPHSSEFSPEKRKVLLQVAHDAILSGLVGEPLAETPPFINGASEWPGLVECRGVFTTLYLHGKLRGCVGYATPIRPLFRAVAETARAAAFEDTRFWAVTAEEAPEIRISLSVLSPVTPIAPEQVEVGRHGLVISDGLHRGLLLPQVAVEHGWDRETFLAQTCRKAGLPTDAWRSSVTIEAFTAEIFGDEGAE